MDTFAVADQQVLRLEAGEHFRWRQPEEKMDTDRTQASSEEPVRADRLRDDEHARLRPPERDFLPALPALHVDDLERRIGHAGGSNEMRHAEPLSHDPAVAVVPVSSSCNTAAGLPSDRARSIASGQSTGSTSQTRPSAASACDVRVIGSWATHEKLKAVSSQSRNVTLPSVAG